MKECKITIGDKFIHFSTRDDEVILPHLADAIKMVYEAMNVYTNPVPVKVQVGEVKIEVWLHVADNGLDPSTRKKLLALLLAVLALLPAASLAQDGGGDRVPPPVPSGAE